MKANRVLVLFDFDGTLTHPGTDSLWAFLRYVHSPGSLLRRAPAYALRLAHLLFQGNLTRDTAKEALLALYWEGRRQEELLSLGNAFARERLPALLRPDLLALLREKRDGGARVAVVSASLDLWLRPFCAAEGIDCLCTELHFENGCFTGRFATPNCNRAEKARRVRDAYHLDDYEHIEAYGNSAGDAALFELATRAWYCGGEGLPIAAIT